MTGILKEKVILVTGSGSGIGRTSALTCAREGAKVAVADINVAGGEETVKEITQAGGQAIFIKADMSKAAEVEMMVNQVVQAYGRIDCAHNNAGVTGVTAPTVECTEENWDYVLDINLKGIFLCMKYEIPFMLKNGGGVIVNTASILGLVGTEDRPAYIASKHGIIGLTKAVAIEYGKLGIRANALCPGPTRTMSETEKRLFTEDLDFQRRKTAEIPMGRFGEALEQAEAVVWLCSDAASFVNGHAMAVDGGLISW